MLWSCSSIMQGKLREELHVPDSKLLPRSGARVVINVQGLSVVHFLAPKHSPPRSDFACTKSEPRQLAQKLRMDMSWIKRMLCTTQCTTKTSQKNLMIRAR